MLTCNYEVTMDAYTGQVTSGGGEVTSRAPLSGASGPGLGGGQVISVVVVSSTYDINLITSYIFIMSTQLPRWCHSFTYYITIQDTLCCTHWLSNVYVETAGMIVSGCVEVRQSGHGTLEVVLLHTAERVPATGDYHTVRELY